VLPHLPSFLHLHRVTPQQVAAATATAVAAGGVVLYFMLRKKVPPEEIEYQRRTQIAVNGRLTDGSIVGIDGSTEDTSADGMLDVSASELAMPHIILYRYRIAGVTYECAQDVSSLPNHVHNLRIDLPVQVRYDPHNPGNSIIVAEEWSGVQHDIAQAFLPESAYESPVRRFND
jgi:hypothetical protein